MISKALLKGTDHFVTLKYLADENMVAANLLSRKRQAPYVCCRSVGPFSRTSRCCGSTKPPFKDLLPLLMTSSKIQNEMLPLLPGPRLCVEVQRGHDTKAAVIRDSACNQTPSGIPRLLDDLDRNHHLWFIWSTKMPVWKEDVLLKCFHTITLSVDLSVDLSGNYIFSVTICFRGQNSVDVCLLPQARVSETESAYEKCIELKDLNERAMAKFKAKTLRRVRTFQSVEKKLVEDIANDLRRVGRHSYPQIRRSNDSYEIDCMWHISVPGTSAQEEEDFRKAEVEMVRS